MNCPYCNKPLYHPIGKPTLSCQNWDCMATDNIIGNHSAWEKIIQLKSQLDIAVDALKWIDETYKLGQELETDMWAKCQYALEQINQKENQ